MSVLSGKSSSNTQRLSCKKLAGQDTRQVAEGHREQVRSPWGLELDGALTVHTTGPNIDPSLS